MSKTLPKFSERTKELTVTGRFLTHFVMDCRTVEEARRCLPSLTSAQFEEIRSGFARIAGDTETGLEYRSVPEKV